MKVKRPHKRHHAFSLVELLVVIAVIGILAAIAIPMISNINSNSAKAKDKRNAQNICSVYGAARAAGAPFSGTTKEDIVTQLAQGVAGSGAFGSNTFKINVAEAERAAALTYCTYDSADEIMSYDPGGGAAATAPASNPWIGGNYYRPDMIAGAIAQATVDYPWGEWRAGQTMPDGMIQIEYRYK